MPTTDWIRWWLGNLPERTISDTDIQTVIDFTTAQYPDATDCQYSYYSLVNLLNWLIREEASNSSTSTSAAGDVTMRRETRGSTTIEEEYSESTTTTNVSDWDSILQDLIDSPNSVGCAVFTSESDTSSTAKGFIGGLGTQMFNTSSPWRKNISSLNNIKR